MSNAPADTPDFIADAERHNEWWDSSSGPLRELTSVTSLSPRSDLLKLLRSIDTERAGETDNLVYPLYGPTGIGKTTVLRQFIASILPESTVSFSPGHRELEILGSVDPRQVLYIPLEDSLYHLEPANKGLDQLRRVVDYFRSHITPRHGREYIILDDIGALRLDEEQKQALLELVDETTYLILAGIVESQVDVREVDGTERIDTVRWPSAMLPMKFIDTVQQGIYADGALADVDSALESRIESQRTTGMEGPSLIADVRTNLSTRESVDSAATALSHLYFDTFSPRERDGLHDAARVYLRQGGITHRADDPAVQNELIHAHFLLYVYKELARYASIQRPENLHRLGSFAASRAGEELRYMDLSDQLEVDRRTVDTYLSALDDGLAVTESHDFSLQRYRRTRLYLRNPRHAVLLSQRQEHHGFESTAEGPTLNHEFEYTLARTVAFDHAKRLSFAVSDPGGDDPPVEYYETDAGVVDYILHNDELVLPFVLSYHPHAGNAEEIATAFDPTVGKHPTSDGDGLRDLSYDAPYRFIITDSLPKAVRDAESLVVERGGTNLCYIPFWLFLLIC